MQTGRASTTKGEPRITRILPDYADRHRRRELLAQAQSLGVVLVRGRFNAPGTIREIRGPIRVIRGSPFVVDASPKVRRRGQP
jgi:hypothetical protein